MSPRRRDIHVVLVATAAFFAVAVAFGLFDRFDAWAHRLEAWQVDEAVLSLAVGSVFLGWFVVRRWREEAARRVLESEADYQRLFDHASDAILVLRPEDEVIVEANRRAEDLYGLPRRELLGRSLLDLSLDPHLGRQQVERTLAAGSFHTFTTRQRRSDGKELQIEVSASTVRHRGQTVILSLNRDITEQIEMRESLRQAQKMEALGRIAGGVAHDFNNLLTVIRGGAELLRLDGGLEGRPLDDLRAIEEAAERATTLTGQLLAFSRRQPANPTTLDLNAEISSSVKMLRRLLPDAVVLNVELPEGLPPVLVDANQLQQVLINLAINSADAMPGGGRLAIVTEAGDDGHVARLTVRDEGTGMNPEILAQAFEPFFTTKPSGIGTGLGLSIVYGVVTQAGGRVRIDSEPGQGTAVVLDFPAAPGSPGADCAARPGERRWSPAVLGSERTILVVADQPTVRYVAGRILRNAGARVVEASDAREALDLLRSDLALDLLLTDVGLPGMGGCELAAEARALRPGLRVRYLSGHDGAAIDGIPRGTLLRKPFGRDSLLRFADAALRAEA